MNILHNIKGFVMEHFDFSNLKTWGGYVITLILGFSIKQLTEIGGLIAIWITVMAGLLGLYLTLLKIVKLRKEINQKDEEENDIE